jgi:hypothetical protein
MACLDAHLYEIEYNFVFKILNKNKSFLDESVAMEKNKINKVL